MVCVCVCVCVCVFVCVCCLLTPFLSVLFVFYRKNLALLHLMNRYIRLLQLSNFLKEKTLWKVNFWYQWITQCNTDSCCEHMTGGANIYLYGCVSLLAPKCDVYLCVYVRVWYQIRVPSKNYIMCQTSVNLRPCCIKHIAR